MRPIVTDRVAWSVCRLTITRHLSNTIEPSMCVGDAAFLSNYFEQLFFENDRLSSVFLFAAASFVTPRQSCDCLSHAFDVTPVIIFFVCVFVNRSVLERLHPRVGSEMWSLRRLLFKRQTGSSLPILEVCKFRFRQFSTSG